ncbi:hypothetical protein WJX81_000101 [Elliptochloris bilobata]|uniref:CTLH domain-containing protein n=1 Tax=Elliptochloris bilobata TaxID=381761 RepID=A0AAW1RGC7_9CHLO
MGPQAADVEMTNGVCHDALPAVVGPRGLIDRGEYVRLLEQALASLGYLASAQLLERESGIPMQPEHVARFRSHVMEGRWGAALALLPQLAPDPELELQARFLILQHKYLEAIESGDKAGSLRCLRSELAPLRINAADLRRLAGCLLRQRDDAANPLLREEWRAFEGASRGALMAALQQRLPPSLMVPERRLEALVEQALQAQVARCPYHNAAKLRMSLFVDYQAGVDQLPTQPAQVLEAHSDEVWHIAFSHAGDRLASASKDCSAAVWRLPPGAPAVLAFSLRGHERPITFLAWSPDDSRLLTCAQKVKLWDTESGTCLHTFDAHQENSNVTACAWLPDGQAFLTGSDDKSMCQCDAGGGVTRRWKLTRINDLALSADGSVLATVCQEKQIKLARPRDPREQVTVYESSPVTSIALSPDGRHLLANLSSHIIHLWALQPFLDRLAVQAEDPSGPLPDVPRAPTMEYHVEPGRQGRFVIRSCFGGSSAGFVASGAEDCRVHIWNRDSPDALAALEGHAGTVNAVAWNPTNPYMLASASDDKTVRIWFAPAALRSPGEGLG